MDLPTEQEQLENLEELSKLFMKLNPERQKLLIALAKELTLRINKMNKNSNLHKAKKKKNDEFYTQLSDIENELRHYKEHFREKLFIVIVMTPHGVIFGNIFIAISVH